MKYIKYIITVMLFSVQLTGAQKTIHNYAYVIIPEQFSFQKSANQYQLNALVKFLLEKEDVVCFMDNEKIPQKYLMIDCGGLKLKYHKEANMFKTKLWFELLDCGNEVVFTSEEGVSREKDYKNAYHESIRASMESFKALSYNYVPAEAAALPIAEAIMTVENDITTYTNGNGFAIDVKASGGSYVGHVKKSPTLDYVEGDLICKLIQTSLPNVYKVQWKDAYGNFINTIGYFDESGNLKIDFTSTSGIQVMTFLK